MPEHATLPARKTHRATAAVPEASSAKKARGVAAFPPFLQRQMAGRGASNAMVQRLIVNQPGDRWEREADHVAQRVMSANPPGHSSLGAGGPHPGSAVAQRHCAGCAAGHPCTDCAEEEEKIPVQRLPASGGTPDIQRACAACAARQEEEPFFQRASLPGSDGGFAAAEGAASRALAFRGGGQPLAQGTRDFFEPRFGQDFGAVRVHTGAAAADSARELGAQAYTMGPNIVFGAGAAAPDSAAGRHLLAHELTHTIQQTGGRSLPSGTPHAVSRAPHAHAQRLPSMDDVLDTLGDAASSAEGELEDLADTASAVAHTAYDTAADVGESIYDTGKGMVDAAGDALDWIGTEAGELATSLADSLGVGVSVTSAGLEIAVPEICPLDAIPLEFDLPSFDGQFMVPIIALPLGPIVLTGSVGLTASLQPRAAMQIGPFCLRGMHILVNPFTANYQVSGSISATVAVSLGAEVRGGLRGEANLMGVLPIGGVPVPIVVPLIGLEGGVAGLMLGMGAGTVTIGGGISVGAGSVSMQQQGNFDLGVAGDLYLGAYGQLDLLGRKVCRIYWEPYAAHGDIAGSLGLSAGVSITPGLPPSIVPTISPPTFTGIPFSQIPVVLSREGFADDCPIKDHICEVLAGLGYLPSQNGGSWNWSGPYGPGGRLPGPLEVYQRDPGIASGAQCRGACGPNCQTCASHPVYRWVDPVGGGVWEYVNFQDCNSNGGCREHDAAFDWAAAHHGETGPGAILMPWHMAANIECGCNNLGGNCIAWIAGLPPYDRKMYFADSARLVSPGGGGGGGGGGVQPHGNEPAMSDEEKLARCERHELPPEICVPLEEEMIRRFGNRDRNLNLDPDKDPKEHLRPDDAPIMASFREKYNHLDSWSIFIRVNHPDLFPEFSSEFNLEAKRKNWLDDLKARTKQYKDEFRDVRNTDPQQDAQKYKEYVLGTIQADIEKTIHDVAVWYQKKTGNTEPLDQLTERVHTEATELWRAEWRRAILQVNRVLARLWPPARSAIIVWVGQTRQRHPDKDLSGPVGELDYIGSLATGYKGPPKQQVRFNPDKFDVDANLDAPPLAKYAVGIQGLVPDRQRIFGRKTDIAPLNEFSDRTNAELIDKVQGYDASDPFDVALRADELPVQQRERVATERLYGLRGKLDQATYNKMVDELAAGGYLTADGHAVRPDLTEGQFNEVNAIMDRYDKAGSPP